MKTLNSRAIALVCITVLFIIAATTLFSRNQDTHAQKIKGKPVQEDRFVRGRLLVKFNDGVVAAHARNIIAALGARDAGEIDHIGVHILELPDQADERALVRAFQSQAEVDFAELDRMVEPADVTPNDPWFPNWEGHLRRIQAPSAWSTTTGNSSVVIAILDTGVDGTHEDLASKVVPGWNVYNNNSNTSDIGGHGTAVAGTAAAASNNAVGVASVCWNCMIMPIRVTDTSGLATYSNLANGLTWAADHGARVANMSFIASDSSTVKSAAQYFQTKGGVVTSSAGNYGTFSSSPDNPYILTVSATDYNDAIYSYSNTGNNIDLAAPGDSFTTIKGGTYDSVGGTSFSAPIVAGVAALVMSANSDLTGSQVQDILKQSADDFGPSGWDPSYGWGRVNAANAVAMAVGGSFATPTPTPTLTPSPSPTPTPSADTTSPSVSITSPADGAKVSINTSIYVSASDNVGVTRVELFVDGVLTATSTSSPFTTKWNTRKAARGPHSLQTKAYDNAGNTGLSQVVTVNK